MTRLGFRAGIPALFVALALLGGCSSSDGASGDPTATPDAVSSDNPDFTPGPVYTDPPKVDPSEMKVGSCFKSPEIQEAYTSAPVVGCNTKHDAEVYYAYKATQKKFDFERMQDEADTVCAREFKNYVGKAWNKSVYDLGFLLVTEEQWENGYRTVRCYLSDPSYAMTKSAKGTNR